MRAAWRSTLEAAKDEARLAVELYNQPREPRRLEAFYIHMHLAWLYLLHARFRREGVDFRYRRPNGHFERVDGEPKTWELARCAQEEWSDDHPTRKNLEVTILLRNKIEHRFTNLQAVTDYTIGYAQALLINFERSLTDTFGTTHSLAAELRFPIFLSTITADSVEQSVRSSRVPTAIRNLLTDFESGLGARITDDQRYEFRIRLIPQIGPRGESDLAVSFVREDELTVEQREALATLGRSGTVIVRQQLRSVASHGLMKPAAAAAAIEARIPFRFGASGPFPRAWQILGVRPRGDDPHPERTDERYCTYDEPHRDYLYTQAFVDKVVRNCNTAVKYRRFIGRDPRAKVSSISPMDIVAPASPLAAAEPA